MDIDKLLETQMGQSTTTTHDTDTIRYGYDNDIRV